MLFDEVFAVELNTRQSVVDYVLSCHIRANVWVSSG